MRTARRRATCLASAAVLLAAAGAASSQDSPPSPPTDTAAQIESARAKAVEATARGDFAAALDALRDAAKRCGPCASLTTQEGVVFLAHARRENADGTDAMLVRALFADARERARQAMKSDPEYGPAVLLFANVLADDGDATGARDALVAWVGAHPKDLSMRMALADRLLAWKDWSGADLHYTKCLELDPTSGAARLNQTVARQWMGVPMEQIERGYLDAARLLPDASKPLSLLLALHPSDRARKLELLGKVVDDNPKAVWARVWIAYLLRKEEPRDDKKALATLRDAERIAPEDATVHFNLGEVLDEAGSLVDAVHEYALAVEKGRAGEMSGASIALDRLLHVAPGNAAVPLAERERAYEALCAKNPDEGRYGNNAGFWLREHREYEKSLKFYLLSIKAAPQDQDFLNDTALIYLFHLTDRRELCLPLYEKVVRLVRKDGAAPTRGYWDTLESLCKYWFEKGDYRKVVEFADQRADPNARDGTRPYPSRVAAKWKEKALTELAKSKK